MADQKIDKKKIKSLVVEEEKKTVDWNEKSQNLKNE